MSDLNQRPSACKAAALPLRQSPRSVTAFWFIFPTQVTQLGLFLGYLPNEYQLPRLGSNQRPVD